MCTRWLFAAAIMLFTAAFPLAAFAQPSAEAIMSRKPAELIATLKDPAAPIFEKAMACQQLARVGTVDAVPALVALLFDEKLNAYARNALEAIPGPAVDEALRNAVDKLHGWQRAGVINSIGQRRDALVVRRLKEVVLFDDDPWVVSAVAGALGRIGTPEAADVLRSNLGNHQAQQKEMAEGCLACADRLAAAGERAEALHTFEAVAKADLPEHLKAAAIYGQLRLQKAEALPLLLAQLDSPDIDYFNVGLAVAREMPGAAVTAALTSELGKLPSDRQALLLRALGDRKELVPLSRVVAASRSQSPAVRKAAIYVLAKRGDAQALPILLDAAVGEGDVAQSAKERIIALPPGKDVDGAIAARLAAADSKPTISLLELVGARGIAAAVPAVRRAADDRNEDLRLAAIRALGQIISIDELPALAAHLVAAKTPREAAGAEEALRIACARMPDREACAEKLLDSESKAPMASQRALLRLLASVGGAKALPAVAASARSDNEELQDAATQALGEWASADAAPALLDLAKTLHSEKFKARALRGYLRIVRQMGIPADQAVAMCEAAFPAAQRDEERKLILRALVNIPSARSLALAAQRLATPALREEAIAVSIAIAGKIIASEPSAVAETMRQVLAAGAGGEQAARAKALLEQATAKAR